ncbi:hypothetical protein VP03_19370, partial [Sinorhizobium meliloti]
MKYEQWARQIKPLPLVGTYGMHISLVVQPFADLLRSGGICISSSGEACGWVLGVKPVCANIGF